MVVRMIFRIITKNPAADPEIGFLTKSILKSYDQADSVSVKVLVLIANCQRIQSFPNLLAGKYLRCI